MKKRLIIISLLVIIALVAGAIAAYWLSMKNVIFTLVDSDYHVVVRNEKGRIVATVKQSVTLPLQPGNYLYTIDGEKYDASQKTHFSVDDSTSEITVNPSYSQSYLASLQKQEEAAITTVINARYPHTSFTTSKLLLHGRGDWASLQLAAQQNPRDIPETYRVILHRENTTWSISIPPSIAITAREYPDVPRDVINSLY